LNMNVNILRSLKNNDISLEEETFILVFSLFIICEVVKIE
jgi:hypothetical protein